MESELLQSIYTLIGLLLGFLAVILVQNYLPSYAREKGKNLATKEDIENITQKIESIKIEYSKQIEAYKTELWKSQQQHLWKQEETKLKIETFTKATVDVAKLINLIKKYQYFLSERELALATSGISKNENDYKLYLSKHHQFSELTDTTYSEFRDVLVEMGGLHALLSIYFTPELSKTFNDILSLADHAAEQKISLEGFSELLIQEYEACGGLEEARVRIGLHYDKLCSSNALSLASQLFFDLLRTHIKTTATFNPNE